MRILEIKYKKHNILNNLILDFKNNHNGYKKIVIIGNNGCGKTTILKNINDFINSNTLEMSEITYFNDNDELLKLQSVDKSLTFGFHNIIKNGKIIQNNTNYHNNSDTMFSNNDDIRKNGCIYSSTQVSFKTDKVDTIKSSVLNDSDRSREMSKDYNFTSVKQLLIDLEAQDDENFTNFNKNPKTIIDFSDFEKKYSKINIFKKAINAFFDNIRYVGLKTIDGHKEIVFEKNGNEIKLDDLSTGEKQIVFRGVIILRDINIHKNGFVLIDEPELSMHPSWCDKIFDYYSSLLFTNNYSIGQLFVATHSERVLASALKDTDTLVVGLNYVNDSLVCEKFDSPLILPYSSSAEISFKIFKVYTNDLHIQLYDHIQNFYGNNTVKDTDEYIKNHLLYNSAINERLTSHGRTNYSTICTAIRNELHHGNPNGFTREELRDSIELMYKICGGRI